MTDASIPVDVAPSPAAPRAFVIRHWRILAVVLVGLGPFAPSILAMSDFLLADNALGFTPFALVAAIYLFWRSAHSESSLRARDLLVDLFFMAPLVVIAGFVLFVLPGSMSWYFWLNRMDLAAMVPWTMAVAIAFLGYQQMLRTWPAWVMLFFAWPYPAVWVQRILTDSLTEVTTWAGRVTTDFARLPYEVGESGAAFTSTHLPDDQNFTLVVGQLCSGTSVVIGFLIVGGGLVLAARGTGWARMRWLLVGTLLAVVSNMIRVSVLLIVASSVSRDFAVNTVHPILGLVLFSLMLALMLALLRSFGLRFDPAPRGSHLAWEPGPRPGRSVRVVWVLAVIAALGVGTGVAQAQEFDFIGIGDGVPSVAVESERGIIPEVPGWDLYHETQISWTDLFGRTSRGDIFSYWQPGVEVGARVGVQTVITEDLDTLNRYSIEQCIDFHRRELTARRAIDLGHGLTGYVLHDTYGGVRGSILYWVMPVNVHGEVRHARIALFGNEEEGTSYEGLDMDAGREHTAAVRLGQALETAMFGLPSGVDDPVRKQMDEDLTAIAVNMVDIMIETGGQGEILAEESEADATATATATPSDGIAASPTATPSP
ncbi:MAG: exosortase/archaeosortase family protein [Dehalococcoidia bacterium]|nr:exosortase/archaeosortase family protein [Dehalococcoidia bacterium]